MDKNMVQIQDMERQLQTPSYEDLKMEIIRLSERNEQLVNQRLTLQKELMKYYLKFGVLET